MSVGEYIEKLLASPRFAGQIRTHRLLPGREARFADPRLPWPAAVRRLLEARGMARLYAHQALATDYVRSGRSVVVATPTASGKSLVYHLPVLERSLQDPEARALYLFPLKALAQDQLSSFNSLCALWPEISRPRAALYDGDTSEHFRRKIRRDPPQVLISNPEMLHLAVLPHHEQWAAFLAGLSHVVVDEAHTYRGVFGAHMAQVFRRLNRLAGRYGARPTYIFCTATVGNPGELAAALCGADEASGLSAPVVVDGSGAPQGPRHVVFIDPEQSPSTAAIDLLKAALARELRTIVYCRSRRMTELISLWAGSLHGAYAGKIAAYRAGYLPEERRDIEARMASGELLAVVSTSALELGIDIGGLDVCILVGYPGTVMATLQRGGRVGRAQQESAVLLVAGEDALDQYFMRHPDDFFSRPPEKAVVNPDNEVILARHLECAAAEMPLREGEAWLRQPAAREAVRQLERTGELLRSAEGDQWLAARKRPQRLVDLRGAGQSCVIEDTEGRPIGTVDGWRVWRETHPGAVYLHQGKSYVVQELDTERGRVLARPEKVGWFTRVRGRKSTDILEETERRPLGRGMVCRGRLRIMDQVTGYEKRSTSGNRLLTIVPLDAPPHVFETEGLWYVFPDSTRLRLEEAFVHFMGAIHALEHAAIGLLPLLVMADRNDFGGISIPLHPQTGLPGVFIYDGLPGGAGLTRQAFPQAGELLRLSREAIASCPCEDGCPSCVHSPKCGSGNRPISKAGAVALVDDVLAPGGEAEGAAGEAGTGGMRPMERGGSGPADGQTDRRDMVELADAAERATGPDAAADLSEEGVPPFVVLDVETRRSAAEVGGWHRAGDMGVSVAVLYDSRDGRFHTYRQEELAACFERLRDAPLVVGFNSFRFDYAVLQPFAGFSLKDLPGLDLLQCLQERLHYRVSLDNVAQATLDEGKSADGLQALRWWKEGRVEEIAAYCRKDVDVTRRVYLFGWKNGYLLFRNKAGQRVRVPVDLRR
ncbi:DEAD/DEAH box helicase [uncultured Desulfovibrio sp.]|uniref:DEAD/DEAH box helicase n=1 Tax=uncultured Desulfovibrio sp. TaxID=167968 RepID=UPI0026093834|nr:DEAD/DEAH box helicase [uncultured Desulfovibrio sp.]